MSNLFHLIDDNNGKEFLEQLRSKYPDPDNTGCDFEDFIDSHLKYALESGKFEIFKSLDNAGFSIGYDLIYTNMLNIFKDVIGKLIDDFDFENFSFFMRDLSDPSVVTLFKYLRLNRHDSTFVKDETKESGINIVYGENFLDETFKILVNLDRPEWIDLIKDSVSKELINKEIYKSYLQEKLTRLISFSNINCELKKVLNYLNLKGLDRKNSANILRENINIDTVALELQNLSTNLQTLLNKRDVEGIPIDTINEIFLKISLSVKNGEL